MKFIFFMMVLQFKNKCEMYIIFTSTTGPYRISIYCICKPLQDCPYDMPCLNCVLWKLFMRKQNSGQSFQYRILLSLTLYLQNCFNQFCFSYVHTLGFQFKLWLAISRFEINRSGSVCLSLFIMLAATPNPNKK